MKGSSFPSAASRIDCMKASPFSYASTGLWRTTRGTPGTDPPTSSSMLGRLAPVIAMVSPSQPRPAVSHTTWTASSGSRSALSMPGAYPGIVLPARSMRTSCRGSGRRRELKRATGAAPPAPPRLPCAPGHAERREHRQTLEKRHAAEHGREHPPVHEPAEQDRPEGESDIETGIDEPVDAAERALAEPLDRRPPDEQVARGRGGPRAETQHGHQRGDENGQYASGGEGQSHQRRSDQQHRNDPLVRRVARGQEPAGEDSGGAAQQVEGQR